MVNKTGISLMLLLLFSMLDLNAREIKICTDSNNWYPFTYEENKVSKGMHVDIATAALEKLGFIPIYTPLPWKRCLYKIKSGDFDALVSGSYKAERAEYLHYPLDAATSQKSAYRLMQVSYVVVSNIDNPYEFNGDLNALPTPIRAPSGYSIVDDLKAKKLRVKTTSKSFDSLWSLIRSQKGVFITTPLNAKMFNREPKFAQKLKIHKKPIKTKSYYLLFAKNKSSITTQERMNIWNSVVEFRNDSQFMESLGKKY